MQIVRLLAVAMGWVMLSSCWLVGAPQPFSEQLQAEYAAQYVDLQRQITAFGSPEKIHKDKAAAFGLHLARLQKEAFRAEALVLAGDRDPVDVVLRRTEALAGQLGKGAKRDLAPLQQRLSELRRRAEQTPLGEAAARKALFVEICQVRRQISLANPLLDFDKLAFLTHHRAQYEHMCDQYYGFHARPGGSVMVLDKPFSDEPGVRDLISGAVISAGARKGQTLAGGSLISLELGYDAKTFYFAWTAGKRTVDKWTADSTYHLFKVDADGKNLVQLTDGPWNDFDPCVLPNGRIVFVSERCGGYLRCGGPRANPTYVLYSMKSDGTDIRRMSYHETHEWHPSVDNDGMLAYTRWDYVDRDSDVAHHIWLSYPDGRDPRSYHGNYPVVRESRPWMEMSIRAIPNSHRYVAVAAPHHGQAYGSLVLIDQRVEDDNHMSQLKRLTPDVGFPESEKFSAQAYGTPWPLSEDFYLCVYDRAARDYGIYLVDTFGNRELIWRDPSIACLDPIPLRARPVPPVIPEQAPAPAGQTTGIISINNVYDSYLRWPEKTQVKALRVIQLFPKETIDADKPFIGFGKQSLTRGVLGTVPIEADGSAHFEAPANTPIYFQALDERGLAVQTMRSDTYLQPGERLTCAGCHEHKWKAPSKPVQPPMALRREPSKLKAEVDGSYPVLYSRLVQPVLDKQCVACHVEKKACDLSGAAGKSHGWSKSYESLVKFAWAKHGGNGSIKINGSERSIPGQVGAHASKLLPLLDKGHYGVKLTDEEFHRITLWIDCNSVFFGAYHDTEKQAGGQTVMPRLR